MRIRDWSSDVCSSDLNGKIRAEDAEIAEKIVRTRQVGIFRFAQSHKATKKLARGRKAAFPSIVSIWRSVQGKSRFAASTTSSCLCGFSRNKSENRKSVVWGKSVSVGLDHGWRV